MKNIVLKFAKLAHLTLFTVLLLNGQSSPLFKTTSIKRIANPTSIEIYQLPFETTFSLGDQVNFEGLQIKAINSDDEEIIDQGFSLSEVNNFSLGEQLVTVNYLNLATSFNIKITNQDAVTQPLVASSLLINEIYFSNDNLYLSLFNGTGSQILLNKYTLRLAKQDEHLDLTLPAAMLDNNRSYLVSNDDALTTVTVNLFDDAWHMNQVAQLILLNESLEPLETILLINDLPFEVINGAVATTNFHLKRDRKHTYPEISFNPQSWRANPSSLFSNQPLAPITVTFEQQAVSYAEYMMYGIGMNAAADYVNIFYHLRDEWSFMDAQSKAFLLNNKKYKISGINEEGKLVSNSFSDAIARYNYLAGKTGNAGLTSANSSLKVNLSSIETIAILSLILLVAAGGYFILRRSKFRFLK